MSNYDIDDLILDIRRMEDFYSRAALETHDDEGVYMLEEMAYKEKAEKWGCVAELLEELQTLRRKYALVLDQISFHPDTCPGVDVCIRDCKKCWSDYVSKVVSDNYT